MPRSGAKPVRRSHGGIVLATARLRAAPEVGRPLNIVVALGKTAFRDQNLDDPRGTDLRSAPLIAIRPSSAGPDKAAFHRYLEDFDSAQDEQTLLASLADCRDALPIRSPFRQPRLIVTPCDCCLRRGQLSATAPSDYEPA